MIKNTYTGDEIEFSVEVFPPKKTDDIYDIFRTLDNLSDLKPDFISVTYGAGGSNSKKTATIAAYVQNICEVEAIAHMTAAGMTKEKLMDLLSELSRKGVKRVLSLRGDKPRYMTDEEFEGRYYKYASDMIPDIRSAGDFRVAVACYPEKHPESPDFDTDIEMLKRKVETGADELISQMFFDNKMYYTFMDRLRKAGVDAPVHAGIMPITAARQLGTSVSLSGSSVPHEMAEMIAKYADSPDDMRKAGIEYAINQIDDLLKNGVEGIHLYSMNKASVAREIYEAIVG